jgi:DDE superfamily endonuclease
MSRPPLDDLRVPLTELEDTEAVAVAFIMSWRENEDGADRGLGLLAGFRGELYCSLGMRRDALFEACDALACRPERVHMLAELCLEPECRRGHGGLYDAVNCGEVRIGRLRRAVAAIAPRRWDDGRIRLACDVSNWLRPDAETSPQRLFCHCYARGKGNAQMIPGWPYSWVAALEPGRTSWTLPLDAVRLGPADDATEVTCRCRNLCHLAGCSAAHWLLGLRSLPGRGTIFGLWG